METLAEYLGEAPPAPAFAVPGGLNYAFGGASVLVDGPPGSLSSVAPKLHEQVGAYMLAGNVPDDTDLFVFLGGANDFFNIDPTDAVPDPTPADVASAMVDTIEMVALAGGKTVLVSHLSLVGDTPLFALDPVGAAYGNWWTSTYNTALDAELDTLRLDHPDLTVIELDLETLGVEASAPDNPFGFTRGQLPIGPVDPSTGLLLDITTDDPDQHLFADVIHPTARAHEVIGTRAAAAVRTAFGFDTIAVTNTSDVLDALDGGVSLREALVLANEMGGEQSIRFDLGAGSQSIHLVNGSLSIADAVSVVGPGRHRLTIDGGYQSRLFDVADGVEAALSHLILTGGSAEQGGAIHNAGTLTLSHTTLASNEASGINAAGGAIFNTGTLNIWASQFSSNRTVASERALGGAIANVGGTVNSTGTLFHGNVVSGETALGGALANVEEGLASLRFSAFLGNRAEGSVAQGAAIYNDPSSALDLVFVLFWRNQIVED